MNGFKSQSLRTASLVSLRCLRNGQCSYCALILTWIFVCNCFCGPLYADTWPRRPLRTHGPLPTPIDRLCFASEIFVATVSGAVSSDCRTKYPKGCEPDSQLSFTLVVDEPLVANEEELSGYRLRRLQRTDTINVTVTYHRKTPYDVEGGSEKEDESFMGWPVVDLPSDQQLSDQKIEQFVGQKLVFGTRRDPFHHDGAPFRAAAWPLRLRPWVDQNLPSVALKQCSRPVGPLAPP
jgi:hypothetical protein